MKEGDISDKKFGNDSKKVLQFKYFCVIIQLETFPKAFVLLLLYIMPK